MSEVDFLKNHSKTKRNLSEASILRTDEVRLQARKFDKDFSMEEENLNFGEGLNFSYRRVSNSAKSLEKGGPKGPFTSQNPGSRFLSSCFLVAGGGGVLRLQPYLTP